MRCPALYTVFPACFSGFYCPLKHGASTNAAINFGYYASITPSAVGGRHVANIGKIPLSLSTYI